MLAECASLRGGVCFVKARATKPLRSAATCPSNLVLFDVVGHLG